ncbi:hypothetical protein WJX82_002165 [Trebouxia sp. C0006]
MQGVTTLFTKAESSLQLGSQVISSFCLWTPAPLPTLLGPQMTVTAPPKVEITRDNAIEVLKDFTAFDMDAYVAGKDKKW